MYMYVILTLSSLFAGPIGLVCMLTAKACGASKVIVTGKCLHPCLLEPRSQVFPSLVPWPPQASPHSQPSCLIPRLPLVPKLSCLPRLPTSFPAFLPHSEAFLPHSQPLLPTPGFPPQAQPSHLVPKLSSSFRFSLFPSLPPHSHACMRVCVCVYASVCACMSVCVCVCVCVCISLCMRECMCMCMQQSVHV